jgi:hypothetical protein
MQATRSVQKLQKNPFEGLLGKEGISLKSKNNTEFLEKIDKSMQEIEEGKIFTFSMEDMLAFADGKYTQEQFKALAKENA